MPLTDAQKKAVLNYMYGKVAFTPSTSLYIGLCTTGSTPTSTGAAFTEPASTDGYARVAIDNSTVTWVDATLETTSAKVNAIDITFPESSGSWGTVTHFGIFTHATSENYIEWAALTTSKLISAGDTPKFSTGELQIELVDAT
jgi:hypothetical protein